MEQTKSKVCLKQGWADLDTVSKLPQTEPSAEMCENPQSFGRQAGDVENA